ncbi:unnamed protein product [Eruca vesicaria subsp. sativa]|uniref:Uncharacterized protein n=1 Tax=Eruca vesicaria subsp. sativa TaxID=29727 RepID=A0ABC8LRR0_ERUVS|nr:unnamed protein product [Eruca vesicaria subsp. sativa]
MLGLFFGDNGHRNGRKDRRSKNYRCDDSDSDSDYEAPPEHKVSRFVGGVSEQLVQPFEIATKLVLSPLDNLLFAPPPKHEKKGRQGQHHSGQRTQHHSGQMMQHQDRVMASKLTRY